MWEKYIYNTYIIYIFSTHLHIHNIYIYNLFSKSTPLRMCPLIQKEAQSTFHCVSSVFLCSNVFMDCHFIVLWAP